MSKITAIQPQVKDKKRVNVYIDGEFSCGLSLETVYKYNLICGLEITAEKLSRMQFESEKQGATEKAVSYISRSMKTEKEVKDYLLKKGYIDTVVFYVLDKLKSYGYVDDFAYAKAYINSVKNKKGFKLISFELYKKGIDKDTVLSAWEETEKSEDACLNVAEKYMKNKEIDDKNIKKLYSHLLSKGFSYDEAGEAVSKIKDKK